MRPLRFVILLLLLIFFALPCESSAVNQTLRSEGSDTGGSRLFQEFIERLEPVAMEMKISNEPSVSGWVNHLYLDIKRPLIGGIRIEELKVEASGIKFTPTSSWNGENIEIENILYVKAFGKLAEDDINRSITQEEFGEEEHWHDLSLDFTESGLYAKGYYLAKLLMIKLDILIEITGDLAIVDKQQIWLDNYSVKLNKVGLPQSLTDKAISKIQPILDLSKFMFPLKLDSVSIDENNVTLRSRFLPQDFEGIAYNFNSKGK